MRREVLDVVAEWYPKYLADRKKIVELGSLDVNGSPRSIFTGDHVYKGVDMREGAGVDIVANFHHLSIVERADAVLCIDTLEHDDAFWLTLQTIHLLLPKDGLLLLSVPTIYYRVYHPHPDDFWRFTPSAFDNILLRGYDVLDRRGISTYDDGPDTLIAIASKR